MIWIINTGCNTLTKGKRLLLLTGAIFLNCFVFAQDSIPRTLSADQLVNLVRSYHPMAKKALLSIERARAGQLSARGVFDPVLSASFGAKQFDGTRYYNYETTDLDIPLWFGLTASAGIARLDGNRLPIEETSGRTGYAGLDWEVTQSILLDKRRAALRSANIILEQSIFEQQLALNDLLKESLFQYWEWVTYYLTWQTLEQALRANEKRLEWVRQMIAVGELAAIDSTEARSQWQYFRTQSEQAQLQWQQASLELSVFLWTNDQTPYQLPFEIRPDEKSMMLLATPDSDLPSLDSLYLQINNHPKLQQYRQQLKLLDIRRKLQFQDILPKINLQYRQMTKGYEFWKSASMPLLDDNFQYGIKMSIPIRMSAARGAFRSTRIVIQQTELDQIQTQADLRAKLGAFYAASLTWKNQITLLNDNRAQYEQLLASEEVKFNNGESSLFIVNNREIRALDARISVIKAISSYQRSLVSLQWSLAGLN